MMKHAIFLSSALLASAAFPAFAADNVDPATIIVTGGGNLAPTLSDRVLAQDVILDVEQGIGSRVENRLRDAAGLVQFRRSDSRSAHPTSQGVTLRGLGGNASSRALVTLDGVPQADPFGGWVAWSAYDAVRLGGITISRGGGSGADGAGALAGTIAMFSDMGQGIAGSAAYGSRNSWDASLNAGGKLGAGSIALDGRYARGDGFIPTVEGRRGAVDRAAAYQQGGLGLRARFDAGANSRIDASIRAFHDERDRGVDFSESRMDGLDASLRLVNDAADAAQWSALAFVQVREMESGFASVGAGRNSVAPALFQRVPATGLGLKAEVRPLLNGAHPLRIGGDWRRTVGRTDEGYFFTGLVSGRRRVAGGRSDVAGLFAEWTGGEAGDGLTYTLSGRVDHWWIGTGYRHESNNGGSVITDATFAARQGWEGSGRAGLRWQNGPVALRGAAYRGWRLPTLNELYRPFRVGADATAANENLTPERLWGGDIGLEWQADGLRLSVTGFANRLDNAIANVTQGVGPGNFPGIGFVAAGATYSRRENLDAIISKGVEFSGGYDLGPIAAEWSYVFTDAHVKASGISAALDGKPPAQIARHGGSFSLRGKGEGPLGGFARLRYMGAQNEDDVGALRLKDALTVDAGLNWRLSRKLTIDIRGENLFDTLVSAAISSGGLIERTSPRTLWVGLRFGM
jgi:vitamin B12 transporter